MIEKLFVYGTLGLGCPNDHILNDIGGSWEKATVTGILLNKGWGAEMGFPGIKLDNDGEKVNGFLFSSKHLAQHWDSLDQFEGEAYTRVETRVELEDAQVESAFIYTLK